MPILLNGTMGDIDPRGEEFAMFIPRFGRFSNVVARGHHLRLPLRSQNRESPSPWSEKYSTINQKTCRRWHDFCHCDQIKTPDPFPRPIPTQPLSNIVSDALVQRASSITRCAKNINNFASTIHNCSVARSSPFLLSDRPVN